MRGVRVLVLVLAAAACGAQADQQAATAVDVLRDIYDDCLLSGSLACARTRVSSFLNQDTIRITRDLSIVPVSGKVQTQDSNMLELDEDDDQAAADVAVPAAVRSLLERVERFLAGHELRAALPLELAAVSSKLRATELRVPLAVNTEPEAEAEAEARHRRRRKSFLRKVVLPFILGLKFKTTALIPLALSLIALKTWKALTLGLLSLVLSAAMVIFRFTKPKIVNYEVYHNVPEHTDHHSGHGPQMAYRAHAQQ